MVREQNEPKKDGDVIRDLSFIGRLVQALHKGRELQQKKRTQRVVKKREERERLGAYNLIDCSMKSMDISLVGFI
jgi:hypothetical protein